MPGCTTCGRVWPDHFQRCPDDGTSLTGLPVGSMAGGAAPQLAPTSNDDLAAGSFAGEYRIEKKIGEGGMGSVYGARHPLIGKRAAIKVIRRELSTNAEAVDRFVLEAQSVNQIGHPNIVDVFGFGQLPDGRSFFVMEWLEGESLRERLTRPLQFPEALEMLELIAKALQAAHEAGVVHRDLKPDNVFLQTRKGEKAQVKLLDFGLAKLTGQGDGGGQRFDRTRTGVVMGTPLYLSPEQAKGQRIDAATDVYSLGAMAYEMLSGSVPFKADSAVEIMAMHISQPASPVTQLAPWVPPEIDALIAQMLDKDPARRPSAADVRERIGACRTRASVATIGMAINPSTQPSGPSGPWTPSTPMPGMHTPAPGPSMHSGVQPGMQTPNAGMYAVGSGTQSPSVAQSSMAQPSGGSKKGIVLIVMVALVAAAVGGVVFVTLSKKQDSHEVASNQGSSTEPAKTDPARSDPAQPATDTGSSHDPSNRDPANAGSDATKTEPGKTEPGKTEPKTEADEPGKTEPGKTEPGKTEPGKTEPGKTEPAKTEPAKTESAAKTEPTKTTKTDPAKTEPAKVTKTEPTKTEPAKTEPAAANKRGKVVVTFEGPAKAMIIVDGKRQGRETGGRVTLDLAAGEHTIRVQAKGFKPAHTTVKVDAGESRDVTLTLQKKVTVDAVHDPFED